MRSKPIVLLGVLFALSGACSFARKGASVVTKSPGTFEYGQGPAASSPPAASPTAEGPAASKAPAPPATTRRSGGSGSAPGANSGGGGSGGTFPAFSEFGSLGSAVCTLVRPGPIQKVNLEIDYVSGRAPSELAVSAMVSTLREVTGKSVTRDGGNSVTASGDGTWSSDEIMRLSQQRTMRSDSSTITLWVGFLDGQSTSGAHVVGSALGATTIMIFPDRYGAASGNLLSQDEVERTVLIHEAGHVLALINIGFRSPRPHEDPEHQGHSRNRASVMYWAVDTTDIGRVFTGTPPYQFDGDDKADLADIAAGRIVTQTCG